MSSTDSNDPAGAIGSFVTETVNGIKQDVLSRAFRAANQLANATSYVLRGQRTGRIYRVPATKRTYQASAPGEAPANRTGIFRLGWQRRTYAETNGRDMVVHAVVENNVTVEDGKLLGEILEQGTDDGHIAARPYKQAVIDQATPGIQHIYEQQY